MQTSEERPIFVVGNQRSGTTLLRYMLCAHSRIFIPPESNFIPRFIQPPVHRSMPRSQAIRVVESIMSYRPFYKDWQGEKPDPIRFIDQLPDYRLVTILNSIYNDYARIYGKPRWGDKTPMYVDHIDALAALFPSAQFIHILRDGRDVALSMFNAYRGPRFWYIDLYYSAEEWERKLRTAFISGARLGNDRYFEVRYEELVDTPEPVLIKMCEFLGEAYEPAMVNPHQEAAHHYHTKGIHLQTRQPPSTARKERWRKEMSTADQRIFHRVAGDLLVQLGYPMVELGKMSFQEMLRFLQMKVKYHLVEWIRQIAKAAGIFHPTKLLVRYRKRKLKKATLKKSMLKQQ